MLWAWSGTLLLFSGTVFSILCTDSLLFFSVSSTQACLSSFRLLPLVFCFTSHSTHYSLIFLSVLLSGPYSSFSILFNQSAFANTFPLLPLELLQNVKYNLSSAAISPLCVLLQTLLPDLFSLICFLFLLPPLLCCSLLSCVSILS